MQTDIKLRNADFTAPPAFVYIQISRKRNGSNVFGIVSADYHRELAITSPDALSPTAFKQIQFRLGLRERKGAAKEAGELADNPELESEGRTEKIAPESFGKY
jgi:hypothetical protein